MIGEMLGVKATICSTGEDLVNVQKIVLPGVGAFKDSMINLRNRGLIEALETFVIIEGKPILGICLGMQVMARISYEGGSYQGLGWLEAEVVKLSPTDSKLRIPHIGWNDITFRDDSELFKGLPHFPDFYFAHSFFMKCDHEQDVEAICDYGGPFVAAVRKKNIFATQFHPEKSQDYGLKLLENFLNWKP